MFSSNSHKKPQNVCTLQPPAFYQGCSLCWQKKEICSQMPKKFWQNVLTKLFLHLITSSFKLHKIVISVSNWSSFKLHETVSNWKSFKPYTTQFGQVLDHIKHLFWPDRNLHLIYALNNTKLHI